MAKIGEVTIHLTDVAEVKAELERLSGEVAMWKAEAEMWEERYDWLLGEIGGTTPG